MFSADYLEELGLGESSNAIRRNTYIRNGGHLETWNEETGKPKARRRVARTAIATRPHNKKRATNIIEDDDYSPDAMNDTFMEEEEHEVDDTGLNGTHWQAPISTERRVRRKLN